MNCPALGETHHTVDLSEVQRTSPQTPTAPKAAWAAFISSVADKMETDARGLAALMTSADHFGRGFVSKDIFMQAFFKWYCKYAHDDHLARLCRPFVQRLDVTNERCVGPSANMGTTKAHHLCPRYAHE